MSTAFFPGNAETILFVGAGATNQLRMPTTDDMAEVLWKICRDSEVLPEAVKNSAVCFENSYEDVAAFLNLLDYPGNAIHTISESQEKLIPSAFPGLSSEAALERIIQLRRCFDWPVLRYVARKLTKEGEDKPRQDFLQGVFDFFDVLLREERGLTYCPPDCPSAFFPPERLRGGRELLGYLLTQMFACAWDALISSDKCDEALKPYMDFVDGLAELMSDEAQALEKNFKLNDPRFYLFSYSVLSLNFEPVFMWLIYNAHRRRNKNNPIQVGNPGKKLQLMLDFPNTVAMRRVSGKSASEGGADNSIWYPVTSAVAQRVNDEKHLSDRVIRIGKYNFPHGSSNFRYCPSCRRLTVVLGDEWNEKSATLFPPGVIKPFAKNAVPRTPAEKAAHARGEYDAIECPFCGELTHVQDNFLHLQTHFKGRSPSFLREITDDVLANVSSVRHVVLLGYRFPPDDAIWMSDFIAMLGKHNRNDVYCSVICGYDGSDQWKYNDELKELIDNKDGKYDLHRNGVEAVRNAVNVFGIDKVRAYTGGIPQVFHDGDKNWLRELLCPSSGPWGNIGFSSQGVTRTYGIDRCWWQDSMLEEKAKESAEAVKNQNVEEVPVDVPTEKNSITPSAGKSLHLAGWFSLLFFLVGIPISYYFQSGIVRLLCLFSIGRYIASIPENLCRLFNPDSLGREYAFQLLATFFAVVLVAAILGEIVGKIVEKIIRYVCGK